MGHHLLVQDDESMTLLLKVDVERCGELPHAHVALDKIWRQYAQCALAGVNGFPDVFSDGHSWSEVAAMVQDTEAVALKLLEEHLHPGPVLLCGGQEDIVLFLLPLTFVPVKQMPLVLLVDRLPVAIQYQHWDDDYQQQYPNNGHGNGD